MFIWSNKKRRRTLSLHMPKWKLYSKTKSVKGKAFPSASSLPALVQGLIDANPTPVKVLLVIHLLYLMEVARLNRHAFLFLNTFSTWVSRIFFSIRSVVYFMAAALKWGFEHIYWFYNVHLTLISSAVISKYITKLHSTDPVAEKLCYWIFPIVPLSWTAERVRFAVCRWLVHSLCGHCSLVQLRDWRSSPWQSLPPVPGEGWVHSLLLHIEQSAPHADHLLHSLQPPSTAKTHDKKNMGEHKHTAAKTLTDSLQTLIS